MKSLLYKEFKLAMHPICYVFILVFPLMVFIPSYPISVCFIYVLSAYPILFLGANKGQQSNDLVYSTLLPVRKKDVVLARVLTVSIMQFISIAVLSCLAPFASMIHQTTKEAAESANQVMEVPGIGFDGFVSIIAIALIGFSIADLIFLPTYYKNGKKIVISTLLSILVFTIYITVFTIVFPYIKGFEWYSDILINKGIGVQFIFLSVSLIIYIALHYLVYKISAKRLEKVDF